MSKKVLPMNNVNKTKLKIKELNSPFYDEIDRLQAENESLKRKLDALNEKSANKEAFYLRLFAASLKSRFRSSEEWRPAVRKTIVNMIKQAAHDYPELAHWIGKKLKNLSKYHKNITNLVRQRDEARAERVLLQRVANAAIEWSRNPAMGAFEATMKLRRACDEYEQARAAQEQPE